MEDENVYSITEAPAEVGREGIFLELLEEFCTNRQRGKNKEDLLVGRPWENEVEGRHYFRLQDFQKFLSRENVRDYTRGQITQLIKRFGGGAQRIKIKTSISSHWIPSRLFEERGVLALPELEPEQI